MIKMQKIWLWVFVVMFAIPEILWSPVLNFYYQFWQSGWTNNTQPLRDNFLQNPNNWNFLKIVIFFELLGLLSVFFYLTKAKQKLNLLNYLIYSFILLVFIIIVALALFLSMVINMRIF